MRFDFEIGQRVELDFGNDDGTWWTVRAVNQRYVILTMPTKKSKTYPLYTVIDWERMVRGPINLIGGGWDIRNDSNFAEKMAELNADEVEVSRRNSVPILITALDG